MRMLHLLRHDVRQHWRLLLAWTLLIIAHPFVAVAFRGEPWERRPTDGVIPALLVIGARLLVGAVLVMTVVQQDAPLDDRTFWRTRPIAPRTMAAAKLLLVALALIALPLLVTLGVAVVAEVPLWYWPTIVFQVLIIDGAIVGVALVSAALTRHLSTGLVVAILTVFLALAVYSYASRTGVRYEAPVPDRTLLADPRYALPTVLVVVVTGLWTIAVAFWWGVRARQRTVVVACAFAVATGVVWYVPAARLHRRPVTPLPPAPVLQLSASSVRAFLLPNKPQRVAVVTDVTVQGREPEALSELWLLDGTLTVDTRTRGARGAQDPNVGQHPGQPLAALLAVMSPEEFAALRGRPAEFRGSYRTGIVTGGRLAEGPLAPTTRLATPLGSLRLSRLATAAGHWHPTGTEAGAVAAGYLTVLRRFPGGDGWMDVVLRDVETGRQLGTLFIWHVRTSLSYLLQLPTVARPFEWDRIYLRSPRSVGHVSDPARARVEMYERQPPVREQADAHLTFVMPSEVAPATR